MDASERSNRVPIPKTVLRFISALLSLICTVFRIANLNILHSAGLTNSREFSVAFPDGISIPRGNLHNEVLSAVGYGLAG